MTADVFPAARVAPSALRRARDAVAPATRAFIARLDDTSAAIASYHLGWTDVGGAPTRAGGGKAVRPALATLSAQAAGAPAQVGIPGAVAVELVHNFSLVHDDVMDGDTERRHRPTVWAVWGASSAILTGDALLALAQEVLLEGASPHRAAAARLLAEATRHLIRGQVLDVAFERRKDVTLVECLDMVSGKTGALLSASAAIGAVLAGAPAEVVNALSTFGAQLGIAFQLVDDLLGIWGDPAITGKPVFSDLRSRKKTLPVTYALTHGGRPGRELADWLAGSDLAGSDPAGSDPAGSDPAGSDPAGSDPAGSDPAGSDPAGSDPAGSDPAGSDPAGSDPAGSDPAGEARAADLIEAAGGRDWAVTEARRRLVAATEALAAVPIPTSPREELIAIAHFIVARET